MPTCLSPIVGSHFRPLTARAHLATLQSGSVLHLDPEPDNRADPNAIRVLSADHHLGYIPSSLNPNINFDLYASNLTILSILAGCPDHSIELAFSASGDPLIALTWT